MVGACQARNRVSSAGVTHPSPTRQALPRILSRNSALHILHLDVLLPSHISFCLLCDVPKHDNTKGLAPVKITLVITGTCDRVTVAASDSRENGESWSYKVYNVYVGCDLNDLRDPLVSLCMCAAAAAQGPSRYS
jgi:hypothetical protein